MLLTANEREKLHKSMLAYLLHNSFTTTAAAFSEETGLSDNLGQPDLLEKKWSSVVRLQQKVMALQNELSQLKEEMSMYGRGKKLTDPNSRTVEGIPRIPEKAKLVAHRDPVTCVAFHAVYSILATSSEDGSVILWDYETGQKERSLKGHTATVNCIAFEPRAGNLLASCSADLTIKIWSFETFDCIRTLPGHDHNVSHLCFVPEGDFILSCSRDKSVKMWEVTTGFCIRTFLGHREWVRQVTVNALGTYMATCSTDEDVLIWTLEQTSPLQLLAGHSNVVETVAFAPAELEHDLVNGTDEAEKPLLLASGSRDKTVRVWDALRGTCLHVFSGHDNWVRQVQFAPYAQYLYSCSDDKSIRLWDLKSKGCAKKLLDAHSHFVLCLAVNPRYPMLATGSVDKTVKIWECR